MSGDEKFYDFNYKVPYWEPNAYQKDIFIEFSINQQLTGNEKLFIYIDQMYVSDFSGYPLLKRNSSSKIEYLPM